jgi:hypothetical protein
VLVAGVATCGTATGKDVDGNVRLFATQTRQTGLRTEDWGGTVNVRFRRAVTPVFSYLVSASYSTASDEPLFALPGMTDSTTSNQVEPRIELRISPAKFDLRLGHRFNRLRTNRPSEPALVRDQNNLFGRFLTRFEKLPQARIEFDHRLTDDGVSPETENTRLSGEVNYQAHGLSASLGTRRTVQDIEGSFERTTDEDLFAGSFTRTLASGRFTFFANYNRKELDAEDRLDEEGLVPIPRIVDRGLLARDDTPQDGSLAAEPALIDGDVSTGTAANIGGGLSGGQTDWNLGVEFALGEPVDVIDVWLDNPIPTLNASRYSFDVYESTDNVTWTLVTASAARQYDENDGRFRLTFPPVTSRFVKVLNRTIDDSLGAVFVSEIEAFGMEFRQRTTERESLTENTSVNLTWSPTETFSATVGGRRSRVRNEAPASVSSSEDDLASLALSFQPSEIVSGSVSVLSSSRKRTARETEDDVNYVVTLTALPVPDLDLTVASSFRDQERGDRRAESGSFLFRAGALLYRDLSVSAAWGFNRQESLDNFPRDDETLELTVSARPRPELEINSTFNTTEVETTIPGDPDSRETQETWTNRVTIRPSSSLGITYQGTYSDTAVDNGWSSVFQADWSPLPGGAFQFSFDYREDAPRSGDTRRIRSLQLRWNLNPKLSLDVIATRRVRESGVLATMAETVYLVSFDGRM